MKKLPISKLDELFAQLSAARAVYIPAEDGGGKLQYKQWTPGMAFSLERNTSRSAKDLFFPQVEDIVGFKTEGKQIETIRTRKEPEEFVLFGVRACDCRSFDLLDRVFLSEPADTFYQARRESAAVVAVACTQPEESCFCSALGIDAAEPGGDITAWMTAEEMFFQAQTPKGERLLAELPLLEEGEAGPVEQVKEEIARKLDALPLKGLSLEGFTGERTMELFNAAQWTALSQMCIGCGTCTFVCPTCQCYDIRDYDTGRGIQRYRCWDSCMYSNFTMMFHGNNRNSQMERFRQRFMHKLVYFPDNNDGIYGCVGCGRCITRCPISMNITKVIRALQEGEHE